MPGPHRKHHQHQTTVLTTLEMLADLDLLARVEGVSRADVLRRWLRTGRAVDRDAIDRARRENGSAA